MSATSFSYHGGQTNHRVKSHELSPDIALTLAFFLESLAKLHAFHRQ